MQSAGRSSDGTFVLGKDTLEIRQVIFGRSPSVNDIVRQRSLSQSIEFPFELIMRTVV
jgi:hypothetical protein